MDQVLEEIHTERVSFQGLGPWAVLRQDDSVGVYSVTKDPQKGFLSATLQVEAEIEELEEEELDEEGLE